MIAGIENSLRVIGFTLGRWITSDPLLKLAKPLSISTLFRRPFCHLWAFFLFFVDFIYF